MHFLVTGGNGYIGSHMCKLLIQKGHQVTVVDNHSTSPPEPVHKYGQFFRADIGEPEVLREIFQGLSPIDGVFHFAAKALVPESEEKPFFYYRENLQKTLSLLESLCELPRPPQVIFSSTCATFGQPRVEQISEEEEQNPINTYGRSKQLIELALKDLSRQGRLHAVVLRYFNVAGSSPELEIGENHEPETHLIPNLCRSALAGGRIPFYLYGSEHPTPDGSCIRDYIHVEDLVRAHFLAFEYLHNNPGYHHFNLGSERGYSVREVIEEFEKVTGHKLEVQVQPARAGDPPRLVASSAKIRAELGFQTQFSLGQMIEHSYNYLKQKETSPKSHQGPLEPRHP